MPRSTTRSAWPSTSCGTGWRRRRSRPCGQLRRRRSASTTAGIVLRDQRTGEEVPFAASVVVNATGPWTDVTNAVCGEPTDHMGGTKGSHIVLDHPELLAATGGRELFFEHKDGRIVLIYPLKGRVLVGTTDLEHDMRDPIVCTEAEVDYFIDLVGYVLPRHPGRSRADRLPLRRVYARFPGHGEIAPGLRLTRLPDRTARTARRAARPPRSSASSAASGRRSARRRRTSPTTRSSCSRCHGAARPWACRSAAVAAIPTTERARRQWIAAHGDGPGPRSRRHAAGPLRHGRRRRDRGDRR